MYPYESTRTARHAACFAASAAQVARRVPITAPSSDRITEYLATIRKRSAGGFQRPPVLDAAHGRQAIRCGHLGNGRPADPGEDVALEAPDDAVVMMRDPVGGVPGVPPPGNDLEAIGRPIRPRRLLDLAVLTGICPVGWEFASGVPAVTGVFQTDVGIDAHGQCFAFPGEAIVQLPPLTAGWGHKQIQALSIRELIWVPCAALLCGSRHR